MDRLVAMKAFVRVVDCLSFTAAARHLHLAPATVSRLVQYLEKQANVRLLNRSTRTVSPTEEGRAYYDACVRVLEQIENMNAEAASAGRAPEGRIKVGLSSAIARSVLIPALPSLLDAFPKLDVEMAISDNPFDFAKDAVDCTIHIGTVRENSVIAKGVGWIDRIMVASPAYLARYGEPHTLAELKGHVTVAAAWDDGTGLKPWEIHVGGKAAPVAMRSRVMANDADAVISCALAGLGIISGYRFALRSYLDDGSLTEIMRGSVAEAKPVSIVYYPSRHMPNKLRTFIDWFKAVFEEAIEDSGN
ncbi:LysR family transcriptional regulator [Burkholderia cepacia]|uniref:LysR family transcriptional regulator n=1 Tax=Burkholderia cepacia TaxID=292 RepID=UPI000F5A7F5F|nr:LysR family transcriptional regulator [Burkholderia cepacia]MCA8217544.1 LysR family transcriptional regulator [Burkholderia cepacia]RQT87199.1 LysR family transcriptional regulator [Burkholderia cepacia]